MVGKSIGIRGLLLLLVVIAIAPGLGMAFYDFHESRDESLENARRELSTVAELAQAGQENVVAGVRNILDTVASSPSVRRPDLHGACPEFLEAILSRTTSFANIGVARVDGTVWCMGLSAHTEPNIADRDYFQQVLKQQSFSIGSYIVGRISNRPALAFGVPVFDPRGQLAGVAFATVDVERLNDSLRAVSLRSGLRLDLVDGRGVIIGSTLHSAERLGQPVPDEKIRSEILASTKRNMSLQSASDENWIFEARAVNVGAAGTLYALASARLDDFLTSAIKRFWKQIGVLGVVFLLGLLLAWLLSVKTIAEPITRLRKRMRLAAKGERINERLPLTLTREMNDLGDGLSELLAIVQEWEDRVLRAQKLASIGYYTLNPSNGTMQVSAFVSELMGGDGRSRVVPMSEFDGCVHPEHLDAVQAHRNMLLRGGGEGRLTYRLLSANGRVRWVDSFDMRISSQLESEFLITGAMQDVTERHRANRLYALLNQVDSMIACAKSPSDVYTGLCQLAVGLGEFRLVWVAGLVENPGRLMPVSWAGDDGSYVRLIAENVIDTQTSQGPASIAHRSHDLVVVDSLADWDHHEWWVNAALERGYRSAASVPVKLKGEVVAAITFYAGEPGFFRGEEQQLLRLLASNVSNSLDYFATEAERKSALQALQASADGLANAQSLAKLGNWARYFDGRDAFWSEGLYAISGRDPSLGPIDIAEAGSLVHPEDFEVFSTAMDDVLMGIGGHRIQYRFLHPDGTYRWFEENIDKGVCSGDGVLLSIGGTVQDVTTRVNAELKVQVQLYRTELLNQIARAIDERRELEGIYAALFERLEGEFSIALAAVFSRVDRSSLIRLEYAGSAGIEKLNSSSLVLGSELDVDSEGVKSCLLGELVYEANLSRASAEFEIEIARSGLGSLVLVPLQTGGEVFGFLLVARSSVDGFDTGECEFLSQVGEHVALAVSHAKLLNSLKSAYEELREAQNTALQQERLRVLGQMASGIAHDINNAISPVSLYTESLLIREMGLSPSGRKQLETIQLAVDDVAGTVARMREFYRPQSDSANRSIVDLAQLAKQAIELTRARWRDLPQKAGVKIDIVTSFPSAVPCVNVVEGEVRDAIVNLILNAIDAMPDGGELAVTTGAHVLSSGTQEVTLEVRDAGLGMDDETRRRCIEPFFTTKGERGSGLGLSMVFGCVQRHQGSLKVESYLGEGTRVRMSFPACMPGASVQSEPNSGGQMNMSRKLLLIDDDAFVLRAIGATLSHLGHTVTEVQSGEEGLAVFHAELSGEPFAAVITDLGMPGLDGRAVAQRVKELSPRTPVLMLTGWGRRMEEEGDLPFGVDALVSKPPRRAALVEALERVFAA